MESVTRKLIECWEILLTNEDIILSEWILKTVYEDQGILNSAFYISDSRKAQTYVSYRRPATSSQTLLYFFIILK